MGGGHLTLHFSWYPLPGQVSRVTKSRLRNVPVYLLPRQLKHHLPHHLCLQLVVQGEEEECHCDKNSFATKQKLYKTTELIAKARDGKTPKGERKVLEGDWEAAD